MNFKKKLQAFKQKKPRLPQEIDQEYSQVAAQIGHKMRIISDLEDQVLDHRSRLSALNLEAVESQRYHSTTGVGVAQQPNIPEATAPVDQL